MHLPGPPIRVKRFEWHIWTAAGFCVLGQQADLYTKNILGAMKLKKTHKNKTWFRDLSHPDWFVPYVFNSKKEEIKALFRLYLWQNIWHHSYSWKGSNLWYWYPINIDNAQLVRRLIGTHIDDINVIVQPDTIDKYTLVKTRQSTTKQSSIVQGH